MPAPAQQPRLSKHLPRSQRNKQRGACKTTDRRRYGNHSSATQTCQNRGRPKLHPKNNHRYTLPPKIRLTSTNMTTIRNSTRS
ncbi:hypothetical protein QTP88_005815 [Uroleucon formosanum]